MLLHAAVAVHGSDNCRAVHVDHSLHPDSAKWADRCRSIAGSWGVPIQVERVTVASGNTEHQARLARYDVFKTCLHTGDVMATAHHADDFVETLLWQLMTGRAPIGIPERRKLGAGSIVRPLLSLSRATLRQYVDQHDLQWIEDPSNQDVSNDRNWIRHQLLPELLSRFPDVRNHLAESMVPSLAEVEAGPLPLTSGSLDEQSVRAWLIACGENPPGTRIAEIIRQSTARIDSSPEVRVSSRASVRRYRDHLYVVRDSKPFEPIAVHPGATVELANGHLTWTQESRGWESSKPLHLTNRMHEEPSKLFIRSNKQTKSLTSLFQSKGIPPWLRDGWPLLMESDRIVCVPDVVIADDAGVTGQYSSVFVPIWNPTDN